MPRPRPARGAQGARGRRGAGRGASPSRRPRRRGPTGGPVQGPGRPRRPARPRRRPPSRPQRSRRQPAAEAAAEPAAELSDAAAEPAAEAAPEYRGQAGRRAGGRKPAAEEPAAEASAAATTGDRAHDDGAHRHGRGRAAAGGGDPAVAAEAAALVQKLQAELKEESALLAALAAKLDAGGDAPAAKADRARDYRARHDDSGHRDHHDGRKGHGRHLEHRGDQQQPLRVLDPRGPGRVPMADVQAFISEPGDKDVRVKEVFTDAMWDELKENEGCRLVKADDGRPWHDYRRRKIVSLPEGRRTRLQKAASMPDRATNTIRRRREEDAPHRQLLRAGFSSLQDWWTQWKTIFETEVKHVYVSYNRPSAPSIPPSPWPKKPCRCPCRRWPAPSSTYISAHDAGCRTMATPQNAALRGSESEEGPRTLDILDQVIRRWIVFVQEAASSFVEAAKRWAAGHYHRAGVPDPKRDQARWCSSAGFGSFEEVDVLFAKYAPVAAGYLLVVQNDEYVLASFHGDTNGLATIPITDAVLGKVGDKT